jgi:signal transduction histidine kinase
MTNSAAPTILVVDDTPANIGLLVDALETRDFRVVVAQDGEETLRRAQFVRPDLILLDVMMPGIDGFETCRRLKTIEALCDVPVIFMTALTFTSDKLAGFQAGGVDYVTKPFQIEEVLARIDTHLALRRMRQEIAAQHAQLQENYTQLQESSRKLEEMQRQLLQAEKIAAIGRLAAGVAHEINNPIGFVQSNLGMLRDYIGHLLCLIDAYEHAAPVIEGHPALRDEIARCRDAADLDFVREDAPKLLAESLDGVRRVHRIVRDLLDFSHVGETAWQRANLHAGLDSTLHLIAGELGGKGRIHKEYSDIPDIDCMPAQINQVFLNLLTNAVAALGQDGVITVRTASDAGWVRVDVADNGCGIAQEELAHIFEPFYTTRPIGQGRGLGLALSYGIVRRHAGRIEVSSSPGAGSTFSVWLPVRQK